MLTPSAVIKHGKNGKPRMRPLIAKAAPHVSSHNPHPRSLCQSIPRNRQRAAHHGHRKVCIHTTSITHHKRKTPLSTHTKKNIRLKHHIEFISHFTPGEIMAMAELGCPHVTIAPHLIKTLLETPDNLPLPTTKKAKLSYAEFATAQRLTKLSTIDPLAGPDWDGKLADMQTDYVANDGEKLDEALERDTIANKRLKDAEVFFIDMENKAKDAIEMEIAAQGL